MRFCTVFLLVGLFFPVLCPCRADVPITKMRRLYDFTPVSATNPILVGIKAYGIGIPVSEYRAYLDSEFPETRNQKIPLTEKQKHLEDLVDDHLLLWEGYQEKADQSRGMIQLLKSTQAMLLRETITEMEVGSKAKTEDDYKRLSKQLLDQTFDKADVLVSNEAYDVLKATVKRLNLTAGTPPVPASPAPKLDSLPPEVRDRPLAKCKLGIIAIGDLLAAYVKIPSDQRPDLETQTGVIEVLKRMLENDLLTEEARSRGLASAPIVLEKMQLNLNTQTRLYALDQITTKTLEKMKGPEHEAKLKQWYQDHLKDLYTYTDDKGQVQVDAFASIHERIENDYFDDQNNQMRAELIRSLRKDQKIEIDEKLLESI
jgi:hypothetical protein